MALIRFLVISICVLYIIRSVVKLLLPMLFNSMLNKVQQSQQQYQQRPKQPEEQIKVDFIPPGKKNAVPDSEGDFIDYEEVK